MSSATSRPWRGAVIAGLLTRQRLNSYLSAKNGDLDAALGLYDWNVDAAAGMVALISMTEVVVRNAMDVKLRQWSHSRFDTDSWFAHAPLDSRGRADLTEARTRAVKRQPTEVHGKVIAELSFGFWRYLAASRYLTSLWVPALSAAFPHGHSDIGFRRRQVEQCLQRLAFVRNRAAHHEPIHQRDLRRDIADAIDVVRWISPDGAAWIRSRESVTELYLRKP